MLLRTSLRQRRRQLPAAEQQCCAKQASELLIRQDFFHQSHAIALYLAFDGELGTHYILEASLRLKKLCYLPVLDAKSKTITFCLYQNETSLSPNQYGILEPKISTSKTQPPTSLDLILLPLVAFDNAGHRLGTGGGYYDRSLAFIQKLERPASPLLIGLGYNFQRVANLTLQPWDVTLDGVITEQQFYSNKTLRTYQK